MLVAIPYWQGDEEQALRLADWMRELGPYPGHSLLVERDVRCSTRQVFERMGLAGFDNVGEIVNPQRIDGWPQGGNSVFQFAARHISYTCPQPWLFLEPDAVPMRRNWIDELEEEYKASDKDFLGDFVSIHTPEMDVPDHMSGVGIYPPDLITCKTPGAGEGLICSQLAWDVVIGQHILPHNMHNSKLLSHAWKHPTFQDWEQVRREIFAFKPDCCLFHASKDGSLILRLQEQRAREAGGIGELSGGAVGSSVTIIQPTEASPSQPVTDILIKTYPKDYEWLSYCLRGLEKFASGFRRIIVVHPINEAGPQLPLEQPIPIDTLPVQEQGEPYLWQQVVKFNAHEYTNATYVLHIDSDTVATAPFSPETFLRPHGKDYGGGAQLLKPLWLMTPYSSIQAPWQPITEKFLGERVDYEFMRRFPMLIPRSLHVAASKFVQIRHNKSAADYIISQPAHDFSEFNALGALAYSRARDDFSWLDTTKEELPELVAIQSWSHGGLSDQLREKFETILVGGGLAHAAAGQKLYEEKEKEEEPICDGGGQATGNLGEVRVTGDQGRSADGADTERDRIVAQNAQGDDVGGVSSSNQTLTPEAGRTSKQTNQGIHQTKEGWWVIDGDTHISKWVEDEGRLDHDQWLLPKILPEISKGDVVVDAGAFIGDHTIAYQKAVGDKAWVIAFEPNPLAAKCLRRNVPAAQVYQVALSSENVAYPFEILPNAGASNITQRSETNVQAIALDSLKLQRLDFFKIDVEGHELSVLKGAEETIMRCRPKLLIEINKWPLLQQGVAAKDILDWLKSHGYRWSSVQPMHVADPPHYDILCRPVITGGGDLRKVVPWANSLETKEEIRGLISRLRDFTAGASPSQVRFVRQELVVHDVTRRPKDYNWVVIRKKRNAMKRRLAKGIKDDEAS